MKVLNSYGITKKENGVENVRNYKKHLDTPMSSWQPSWIKPPPNMPPTQN